MVAFFMFFEKGYKTYIATGRLRQTFAGRRPERVVRGGRARMCARACARARGRGRGRGRAWARASARARGRVRACAFNSMRGARVHFQWWWWWCGPWSMLMVAAAGRSMNNAERPNGNVVTT
jgi:hypothetical protein